MIPINDLQRQADFDVIFERILSGLHDQRIGRRRERRGETHARSHRDREQERIGARPDLYGGVESDRRDSTAVAVLLMNIVINEVVK